MSELSDAGRQSGRAKGRFATTIWDRVLEAGNEQSSDSAAALEALCQQYWPPVYAYLRRKGHCPDEARDLTQGFFAFWIAHHAIARADPARGRFRNFLIASLENYLSVQRRHEAAVTRGVTKPFIAWDDAAAERMYASVLVHSDTPERLFEKRWTLDLLERVHAKLRDDFAELAKSDLLEALEEHLWDEPNAVAYDELSRALGLTAGALRVTVHRLRQRFRQLLLAEIADTGVPAAEIDDEIRQMMDVLGR
jgi:RNA polymerase sigma factor (sigma-70 family)